METEQKGPELSEEERAQLNEEQRRSYLRDVGEAVSGFLRPFGIKVDVDVVDESTPKPKDTPQDGAGTSSEVPPDVPSGASVDTVSLINFSSPNNGDYYSLSP